MRRQGASAPSVLHGFVLPARLLFSGVGCAGFFPSASRIFSLSVYSLPFFSVHSLAVGNSHVYDI